MSQAYRAGRDHNVLAAWALVLADAVRDATEKSTGMRGNGPAALVAIVADPGMHINELSRVLALTHPGTVRLVDRMVERGWVRRESGQGRVVRLQPSGVGRAAERRLAAARSAAAAESLAGLSSDQLSTIARLVDPVLIATIDDVDAMRRTCRLCDRATCSPCPIERASTSAPSP